MAEYEAAKQREKEKVERFQKKSEEAIKTITRMAIEFVSETEKVLPSELEDCQVFTGSCFYISPGWVPEDFKIVWNFFPPITISTSFTVTVNNAGEIKSVSQRRGFIVDEYGTSRSEEATLGKALVQASIAKKKFEGSTTPG